MVAQRKDPIGVKAGDLAEGTPVLAEADDDVSTVLDLMADRQVRRLPVVENNELVGIIARADIARALNHQAAGETIQAISERKVTSNSARIARNDRHVGCCSRDDRRSREPAPGCWCPVRSQLTHRLGPHGRRDIHVRAPRSRILAMSVFPSRRVTAGVSARMDS